MKNIGFLMMFSFLLINEVLAAPSQPPPAGAAANHFLMVLQWSKAYCSLPAITCQSNYKTAIENRFYIHGLWPKPQGPKATCPGKTFDRQEILNFLGKDKRLENNWANAKAIGMTDEELQTSENVKFWMEQWEKHGRCQTLGQSDYFRLALDIYDDISNVHTGIVQKFRPKNSVKVIVKDIVNYVKTDYKLDIDISCNKDESRNEILFEMYFDLTLSGELKNITGRFHNKVCPPGRYVEFV